jgi:hypothetical protein
VARVPQQRFRFSHCVFIVTGFCWDSILVCSISLLLSSLLPVFHWCAIHITPIQSATTPQEALLLCLYSSFQFQEATDCYVVQYYLVHNYFVVTVFHCFSMYFLRVFPWPTWINSILQVPHFSYVLLPLFVDWKTVVVLSGKERDGVRYLVCLSVCPIMYTHRGRYVEVRVKLARDYIVMLKFNRVTGNPALKNVNPDFCKPAQNIFLVNLQC